MAWKNCSPEVFGVLSWSRRTVCMWAVGRWGYWRFGVLVPIRNGQQLGPNTSFFLFPVPQRILHSGWPLCSANPPPHPHIAPLCLFKIIYLFNFSQKFVTIGALCYPAKGIPEPLFKPPCLFFSFDCLFQIAFHFGLYVYSTPLGNESSFNLEGCDLGLGPCLSRETTGSSLTRAVQ